MKKIISILLILILIISFTSCTKASNAFVWTPPEDSVQISETDPAGTVLMDNDRCKITIVECLSSASNTSGTSGFAYQLSFQNKSDADLTLKIDSNLAVNGFYIQYYLGGDAVIEAGTEETANVFVPFAYCENLASTFEDINVVQFSLSVYETSVGEVQVYTEGEEDPEFFNPTVDVVIYTKGDTADTVTIPDRPSSENEIELVNNDDFAIVVTGFDNTGEGLYTYLGGYVAYVYLENKTDGTLCFDIGDTMLDGNLSDLEAGNITYVPKNQRAVITLQWYMDSNKEIVSEASNIEFDLTVTNYASGDVLDDFDQKTFTLETW